LSDTKLGALEKALAAEHVASRRPPLVAWIRDLIVAHASEVLKVTVTRATIKHQPGGVPSYKQWQVARAVRRAAARRRQQSR
jgi:hypothetical protein